MTVENNLKRPLKRRENLHLDLEMMYKIKDNTNVVVKRVIRLDVGLQLPYSSINR